MSRARVIAVAALAGLISGAVVLGIGGRLTMRAVAYADPAPARFTWLGALEVLGAGAVWGALTGPVVLACEGLRARLGWATGLVFGVVVLASAAVVVGVAAGFEGRIVAPPLFIILSAVLFPMLFLAHGVFVDVLVSRWRRGRTDRRSRPLQPSNTR